MGQLYRTLKVEPTFRLVTTDGDSISSGGPLRGQRDGKRIVRVESSFRIVGGEARQAPKPVSPVEKAQEPLPDLPDPEAQANKNLFEALIRKAPDAIFLVGAEGRILFANSACIGLLGYQPDELVGEPVERLVPEEARAGHAAHRAGFHATAPSRPMARITKLHAVHKDGHLIPVDVAVSPLDGEPSNPIYVVAVRDAAAQSALVSRLEELATTDPLTGVPNRRSFDTAGEREFERFHRHGSPLSVMIIDIDHFKAINDTYGHKVGDDALVLLASTCLSKLRRTDLLARIGGEEFAILIPGSKSAEAMMLAERVREGIGALQMPADGGAIQFTVSVGLTEASPDDRSMAEAIERADRALYEAKRNGRNQIVNAPVVARDLHIAPSSLASPPEGL